ncbi:hypothetical protein MNB_SV-14-1596 [hydrothermal vent metagenome]|uniref:Lipoprotein n=1 Tax=hydrothermal vent metagenome TaxID=652676 RepID=A0A1W1C855_9ZZZZ
MSIKSYLSLSVLMLFFFTACQQSIKDITPEFIKKIPTLFDCNSSNTQSSFIKEERENNSTVPDIYGIYNLIEGSYNYGVNGILKKEKIKASTIVIEQLSPTEFGFYYITELKDSLINRYFGGFTYKDGKFYQKVIDYPNTNTLLRDNITLTKKGNLLRLTVKSIDEQRTILWGRSKEVTPSLKDELEDERDSYISLYKKKLFP